MGLYPQRTIKTQVFFVLNAFTCSFEKIYFMSPAFKREKALKNATSKYLFFFKLGNKSAVIVAVICNICAAVLFRLTHAGGKRAISRCMAKSLEAFLFFLPELPPTRRRASQDARQNDRHHLQMLDLFPWLRDDDEGWHQRVARASSSQAAPVRGELGNELVLPANDDAIEEGMRALEDARVALKAVPRSTDDFRARLVMRSELLAETGNALQAIVGERASDRARDFCLSRSDQECAAICVLRAWNVQR